MRGGSLTAPGPGRLRSLVRYPGRRPLPRDALEKGELDSKHICRTFSDCTTGPRKGLMSGCFPLDTFYKNLPEAKELKKFKAEFR